MLRKKIFSHFNTIKKRRKKKIIRKNIKQVERVLFSYFFNMRKLYRKYHCRPPFWGRHLYSPIMTSVIVWDDHVSLPD